MADAAPLLIVSLVPLIAHVLPVSEFLLGQTVPQVAMFLRSTGLHSIFLYTHTHRCVQYVINVTCTSSQTGALLRTEESLCRPLWELRPGASITTFNKFSNKLLKTKQQRSFSIKELPRTSPEHFFFFWFLSCFGIDSKCFLILSTENFYFLHFSFLDRVQDFYCYFFLLFNSNKYYFCSLVVVCTF